MSVGENLVTAVVAAVTGGGLWRWLSKRAEAQKAEARTEEKRVEAEAGVASKALDLAADVREDTQQTTDQLVACEKRCARIESRMERLEVELEAEREFRKAVQGELANANQKVECLERMLEAVSAELDNVLSSIGLQRVSSRPPPSADETAPQTPASKLRIVEERGPRKGAPRR